MRKPAKTLSVQLPPPSIEKSRSFTSLLSPMPTPILRDWKACSHLSTIWSRGISQTGTSDKRFHCSLLGLFPVKRDRAESVYRMTTYILRRLLQTIALLFLLSIILFTLVNIAPGGPLSAYGGRRIRPERVE